MFVVVVAERERNLCLRVVFHEAEENVSSFSICPLVVVLCITCAVILSDR